MSGDMVVKIAVIDDMGQMIVPMSIEQMEKGLQNFFIHTLTGRKPKADKNPIASLPEITPRYVQQWLELKGYDFQGAEVSHVHLHNRWNEDSEYIEEIDATLPGYLEQLDFIVLPENILK